MSSVVFSLLIVSFAVLPRYKTHVRINVTDESGLVQGRPFGRLAVIRNSYHKHAEALKVYKGNFLHNNEH